MHGIVVGGTLNRRVSANKSSAALGSYADGAYIYVENYNDDWYKTTFTYNGESRTGYVMKAYVARTNDTVQVRKNSVNVRNAANGSTVLCTVNSGASSRVIAIEEVGNYGWIKGNFGNSTGWIRGDMFTKTSGGSGDSGGSEVSGYDLSAAFNGSVNAKDVTLRYGPGTSYGARGTLNLYAKAKIRMITAGGTSEQRESWLWCDQSFNNVGSGYVYARYLTVPHLSGYTSEFPIHKITGDSVNIRVRPATSAESFGRLNRSDEVAVLDTSHSGWWRVGSSLGIGWVSSDYID